MHREEGLSFAQVVTFNLDEYYPMDPGSVHSYHRFMWENLFSQLDIVGGAGRGFNTDTWDGYPGSRDRVVDSWVAAAVRT